MSRPVVRSLAVTVCLFGSMSVYAAQPVDLSKQPMSLLRSYMAPPANTRIRSMVTSPDQLAELKRSVDRNHTTHIRVQQTHNGIPVWGADAVVHMPAASQFGKRSLMNASSGSQVTPGSSMNGVIYQQLEADLKDTPKHVFAKAQADKAMNKALSLARSAYGTDQAQPKENKLMVYVDKDNKAHYAFLVSVYLKKVTSDRIPAYPVYILDAVTLNVYKSWNNIKTIDDAAMAVEKVNGGGFGGNPKTKQLSYDGLTSLPKHLSALAIQRNGGNQTCSLRNDEAVVFDGREDTDVVMSFPCSTPDAKHNMVFWDGNMDHVNGGYSPANDAMYAGSVIQEMYQQWLGVPMLVNTTGKPMLLRMYAHYGDQWENAAWDPNSSAIYLGDGKNWSYPLTSLGVIAHEVSHGFTSQHSDLVYEEQSGSMNEAFSDMAAQAAEQFSIGQPSWQIGPEIVKANNSALRYMDQPSKDCHGRTPGDGCSIDDASQYSYLVETSYEYGGRREEDRQGYIVHLGSGVYNRAFYLLATSPEWDAKKAFTVMAQANANYWTKTSTFAQGACGVMKAAGDLHYDTAAIAEAFNKVGVGTKDC